MKKLLFIATIASIFIACEGPMGPQGPQGQPGKNGEGANWYSTTITVEADEWELKNGEADDLNTYYFASKPLHQLTPYIYERGSVIAYIENLDGVKNGMPFVWHRGEETTEGKLFLWTETYDFDFTTGEIGFYITYSDFSTNIRPDTKTFHIVMFWP